MKPQKVTVALVSLYIAILLVAYIIYSNMKFTGSDPAGNGLARGFTLFYGLGIFFLIAVVFTIINAFYYKGIKSIWVKILFFVPISLPLLIFTFIVLEIGRPKVPTIDEQFHKLTFEVRNKEKLDDLTLSFNSSSGGSLGGFDKPKAEAGYFVYKTTLAIYYDDSRVFYLQRGGYKTTRYDLKISYKPQAIPFTNWESLNLINVDSKDTVRCEFRYRITKG